MAWLFHWVYHPNDNNAEEGLCWAKIDNNNNLYYAIYIIIIIIWYELQEVARDRLLYTDAARNFYRANAEGERLVESRERGLKFIECLKRLTNYSVIVLKPKHMRPEQWEVRAWLSLSQSLSLNHYLSLSQPLPLSIALSTTPSQPHSLSRYDWPLVIRIDDLKWPMTCP